MFTSLAVLCCGEASADDVDIDLIWASKDGKVNCFACQHRDRAILVADDGELLMPPGCRLSIMRYVNMEFSAAPLSTS